MSVLLGVEVVGPLTHKAVEKMFSDERDLRVRFVLLFYINPNPYAGEQLQYLNMPMGPDNFAVARQMETVLADLTNEVYEAEVKMNGARSS
jgi:hypothetical protein